MLVLGNRHGIALTANFVSATPGLGIQEGQVRTEVMVMTRALSCSAGIRRQVELEYL